MRNSLFRDLYVRRENLTLPLAELTLKTVNSALSQAMLLSLKRDPLSFVNSSIRPMDYEDALTFRKDYLCAEMFSKYPFWDTKIDRAQVALTKFLASEAQCRDTNLRLASTKNYSFWTTSVFATASRKIANLLGPFDWNEAEKYFGFGPGSTTRLRKTEADWYYKLSGIPECTPNCVPLAVACLKLYERWGATIGFSVKEVPGNKVITVPKNAKTDRVIAKEPCMNIFIQKGLGGIIRRRLKRVGVDLNDQTKNQVLAHAGSLDNSLATIDLSAASDTISLELCRQMLPPDWFDALLMCRSERGVLPDGTEVRYQKVSSMGNGFTFELESLIFWALACSVRSLVGEKDRRMAVYGDDVIVPTQITEKVLDIFTFAGFTVNEKKTHIDGPFRESCGKHYFLGSDVTPIYIKDKVDSYPRYIWLTNQLKRWSRNPVWGLDSDLKDVHDFVRGRISGYWSKARIPDGLGDGALIGDFDEVVPNKAPHGHCGYISGFFVDKDEFQTHSDDPTLLKSLYSLEITLASDVGESVLPNLGVPLRKRRFSKAKRAVWQWQDLGPWLA